MTHRNLGFTIVEIMVAIGISAILVVSIVAVYATFLQQGPRAQQRNELATNLQNALERINDDVRRATNVTVYNGVADPSAPTVLMGEYANVPGPDEDPNNYHTWRIGENRLILNQTPVDATGNPIYTDTAYAAGEKNSIVYYVHNNALYRRAIGVPATTYANNTITTVTCARTSHGGCQAADIKVLDNLKASLGDAAFAVKYFSVGGGEIDAYTQTETGPVADYSGFSQTRSVAVSIELESGAVAGGAPVELANSMRMQMRGAFNTTPPNVETPDPPEIETPPGVEFGDAGLMVGPGGLLIGNYGFVDGGTVYVKGQVRTGSLGGQMGGTSGALTLPGMPPSGGIGANAYVANLGCGTTNFPEYCTGQQPVDFSAVYARFDGGLCATGQTSTTHINAYGGLPGLRPSCTAPVVNMPTFDKAGFSSKMTNGTAAGSSVSCSSSGATTQIAANRTYTGNVAMTWFCTGVLNGSAYIKGDLVLGSQSRIRVSDSVGTVRPIIVVNGRISLDGGSVVANNVGTTPYFISFFSSDSSCSNSDSCVTLAPAKLKETLDAYHCTNATFCAGTSPVTVRGVKARGSTFYSYFGEVASVFYAEVGALGGQRVFLETMNLKMDATL